MLELVQGNTLSISKNRPKGDFSEILKNDYKLRRFRNSTPTVFKHI